MMKDLMSGSYLSGGNAAYIDELYEAYLQGQEDIAPEWKSYFDRIQVLPGPRDVPHEPVRELIARIARERSAGGRSQLAPAELAELGRKQAGVFQLISSYRFLGVRHADLDPLKRMERQALPELEPEYHGLSDADMDRVFDTGTLVGPQQATLRDILQALRETYCGTIGLEYMYITDTAQKKWLQQRFEGPRSRPNYAPDVKRHILERLTAAEILEKYLHTRFVGQKRFSLEGGDSLIPMLDALLQRAGQQGVQELVIGMAHRGRLNVLVNTLGKLPADLFQEFEGKKAGELPAGDVKYHQGFSSDVMTAGGPMHLTLAFNPSHLEIVNPVVEGSVRARQHRRRDREGRQVMPVLIHGDAAFAGQGVVMETMNLSQTRGYGTGGTVHIIVNNQIGFTTSDPRDTRSTIYCTDVAKMVEAPVIHVNGD
ncbi:MAG: thiamine pyrophosphate-dependent enzyme, partial [Burkholderiales bacterium]